MEFTESNLGTEGRVGVISSERDQHVEARYLAANKVYFSHQGRSTVMSDFIRENAGTQQIKIHSEAALHANRLKPRYRQISLVTLLRPWSWSCRGSLEIAEIATNMMDV